VLPAKKSLQKCTQTSDLKICSESEIIFKLDYQVIKIYECNIGFRRTKSSPSVQVTHTSHCKCPSLSRWWSLHSKMVTRYLEPSVPRADALNLPLPCFPVAVLHTKVQD
jgi:hypothetical protein